MKRSTSWVAILVLASSVAGAQGTNGVRAIAEQKVFGLGFALEYGVVSAADRTLADLGVGQFWNPGAKPAILTIEAPLRVKDALLAPGRYGVKFGRRTETEWTMVAQGAPRSFTRLVHLAAGRPRPGHRSAAPPTSPSAQRRPSRAPC